uniref:Uncharacterized protein n=1 Tax=Alexandrium catenella TaxID=2925 RepID=A0A7S1RDI0_ALECA
MALQLPAVLNGHEAGGLDLLRRGVVLRAAIRLDPPSIDGARGAPLAAASLPVMRGKRQSCTRPLRHSRRAFRAQPERVLASSERLRSSISLRACTAKRRAASIPCGEESCGRNLLWIILLWIPMWASH